MKTYTFFIYRPIATIVPLAVFFSLTFVMLWILIPLMPLIFNPYIASLIYTMLALLIVIFVFYVRKKLLIKVVALLDADKLKIEYEGYFLSNKNSTLINCAEIYSITLKKHLKEEYRLIIKYRNERNKEISFIKLNELFSVKDDFLVFAEAIKYNSK